MTNREALLRVIEKTEVGHKSSLDTLRFRASALLHEQGYNPTYIISKSEACNVRSKYCRDNNIDQDMRKHGETGSPRRNQMKDTTATLEQVTRLVNYLKVKGNTFKSLLDLVGNDFHSIEQLRNTMETLKQLQVQMS